MFECDVIVGCCWRFNLTFLWKFTANVGEFRSLTMGLFFMLKNIFISCSFSSYPILKTLNLPHHLSD